MHAPGHDASFAVGTRAGVRAATAGLWAFCFARRIPPLSLSSEWVRFDGRTWEPDLAAQDRGGWFPARWDDLARCARSGVLEIGAHGATHTPWSWLSEEERRHEIGEPRERLQQMTGSTLSACAYPHGMYDDAARAEVRRHFAHAFTTQPGAAAGGQVDALPRFHVPSERPVNMELILRWPFAGRVLRKGMSMVSLQ